MYKINNFIISLFLIIYIQISKSEDIPDSCTFKSNFYGREYNLSSLSIDKNTGYKITSDNITYTFNICGVVNKCYYGYYRQSCISSPYFQILGDFEKGTYSTDGASIILNYLSDQYSTNSTSCLYESTFEISCTSSNKYNLYISSIEVDKCHYKFKLLSHLACFSGVVYPNSNNNNNNSSSNDNSTQEATIIKAGDIIPIYVFLSDDFKGESISFKMVNNSGIEVYKQSNIKYSNYNKGVFTYNLVIPSGNYQNGTISTSADGFIQSFAYINPYSGNNNNNNNNSSSGNNNSSNNNNNSDNSNSSASTNNSSFSSSIDILVLFLSSSSSYFNFQSTNYSNSNNLIVVNDSSEEGWSNWKIAFVVVCGVLGATLIFGTLLFINQRNRIDRKIRDINLALKNSPKPQHREYPTHHPESNPNFNFENYHPRPTQQQQPPKSPPPAYSSVSPDSNEKVSISLTSAFTVYEEVSTSSNSYNNNNSNNNNDNNNNSYINNNSNNNNNNNNNQDDESDYEDNIKSKIQSQQKMGEGCKTQ